MDIMAKPNTLNANRLLVFIIFFLFISLAIVTVLYYRLVNEAATDEKLLSQVSRLILLPVEKPIIITLNPDNLADFKLRFPDFYKQAIPGDKLFNYPDRALLYRMKEGKIINIFASGNGIFRVDKVTNPLLISFRYNPGAEDRAFTLKSELEKTLSSGYKITEVQKSPAGYKNDVIYLVNKDKKDLVQSFAKMIGDSPVLETLEKNETPVDADLIVAFK